MPVRMSTSTSGRCFMGSRDKDADARRRMQGHHSPDDAARRHMTPASKGEADYLQGIASWEDCLKATDTVGRITSWVDAVNSLHAAVASPHISLRSAADAYYKLGLLHMLDSEPRRALDYFKGCLSINPHAAVHDVIGTVYGMLKDHENSVFHYRQAIALGGASYVSLGRALLAMGQTKEAIECFDTAISSKPSANALFWKGNAHRQVREVDHAMESYLAALNVHDEDAEACQALAEVFLEDKNDAVTALVWFDKMYTLPDTTSAIDYCRTRTPFAAYFCERYPKASMRSTAFEALCALRRAVLEVKQLLYCNSRDTAVHYTSLETSKALILDKSPFRVHRADRMNDPSEGAILSRVIGEGVAEFLGGNDEQGLPSAYIGSFVVRPEDQSIGPPADDDLLHWRLYGRSDGIEASGACLVYPCNIFSQTMSRHETASLYHSRGLFAAPTITKYVPRWQALTPRLYEVAYDGVRAEGLIERIRPPLRRIAELKRTVPSNEERTVLSNCVRVLLEEIRYLFKSGQFEYEGEARVVVTVWPHDQGIKRDPESGTEFIELGRNVYPIAVALGPCAAENPFTGLEAQRSNLEVRRSRVPYGRPPPPRSTSSVDGVTES